MKTLLLSAVFAVSVAPAFAQQPGAAPVTFTKDVAPILQRTCQTCHRPGQTAPMSLLTYEDARPWARAMKARVSARQMPPWHLDRSVGVQKFKDDPSLTDEEIATIVAWVDAGAPKGNPADMPAPRTFADNGAWQIGQPDLIVKSTPHRLAAAQPDWFGSYVMPTGLTEDRYIKAIQTRPNSPGALKVVHHTAAFAVDGGAAGASFGDDSKGSGQFLVEYASGKGAEFYPEGSGVLLQAGKKVQIDFHLHASGEEAVAQVELGIVFYPKGYVPKHIRWTKQLGQSSEPLDIAPGAASVRTDGYTRLNKAARITAFQPHMHIRGKRQCLELIYPTGRTELVNCANFNYNWHLIYNYADDSAPIVPAGTLLHVISWHDNSSGNRFNPDPRNWVGGGSRTIDEMAFSWIGWYDLSDSEYKEEIAARKALNTSATQQQ